MSQQPALYKSGARITGFDGRPDEFLFLSREYDYRWHKTSNACCWDHTPNSCGCWPRTWCISITFCCWGST